MENSMKNLFVPYEIAKQLKKKGFDEPCLCFYQPTPSGVGTKMNTNFIMVRQLYNKIETKSNADFSDNYTAPLYQQVVDWFREKHNTSIVQIPTVKMFCFGNFIPTNPHTPLNNKKFVEDNYYEALTKAIEEALKLIK